MISALAHEVVKRIAGQADRARQIIQRVRDVVISYLSPLVRDRLIQPFVTTVPDGTEQTWQSAGPSSCPMEASFEWKIAMAMGPYFVSRFVHPPLGPLPRRTMRPLGRN
jgi:hypothetical protein